MLWIYYVPVCVLGALMIATSDVCILKNRFSNQQIMWSTVNSESGNQQNRACDTVSES